MGYRSNGYFIIPTEYSEELERRVMANLDEEEKQRILSRKKANEDGSHFVYSSTRPWNPLLRHQTITLIEDSNGSQYYKYTLEDVKWYGSGFPEVVEKLLNDIAYPEENYLNNPEDTSLTTTYKPKYTGMALNAPTLLKRWVVTPQLAIFCLQGQEWDDTIIFDPSGRIGSYAELQGSPWSSEIPQILVMVDADTIEDPKNRPPYKKLLDKLNALNPTESGNPTWSASDGTQTFFYWDLTMGQTAELFTRIRDILREMGELEASGFAIEITGGGFEGFKDFEINGADPGEWDIWPLGGWDESGLDFTVIKEIPLEAIHNIES